MLLQADHRTRFTFPAEEIELKEILCPHKNCMSYYALENVNDFVSMTQQQFSTELNLLPAPWYTMSSSILQIHALMI